MRYFILLMLFLIGYLLIHLYYSFCQHLDLWAKVAVMGALVVIVLLCFAMHPAEWMFGLRLPESVKFTLNFAIAFFMTLAFFYMFADVLKLMHLYPGVWKTHEAVDGFILAGLAALICIGGYFNNMRPTEMNYEIVSPKVESETLIAVISDIHIGSENMSPEKLGKAVQMINKRQPDLVVIAGDMFDGRTPAPAFIKGGYGDILSGIKSKNGVYAITGNHEFYTTNLDEELDLIRKAGVKILRDERVFIKPMNAYLIGCDDAAKSFRAGEKILPLKAIMPTGEGLKIVAAHNPDTIGESVANGADVQISGHTHNGQLFPINFVLKLMFATPWGLKKVGDTMLFVSSGLGMWGPPVRTSSVSEVAFITLKPSSSRQ